MQKQAECSREANGQATGQTTVQEAKHNTMTNEVKDKDGDIERIFMEVPFTGKSTRKFIQDVKGIARDLKPTAKIIAVSKPPKAVRHFFRNKDPI
ncbi:unnamed protein product, partial [Rotaria magnacalcarata]